MRSIVDPIRLYLPQSVISEQAMDEAVNIHFFHEEKYRVIVPFGRGVHVFMSHGIADKGWRDGPSMSPFDYVCVSGPLWEEKLVKGGISPERILRIGFPKLDPLFQAEGQKQPRAAQRKTVLYAPTHARAYGRCSSFPAFEGLLSGFPQDLRVVSSPHPVHKENQMPTLYELAQADVVISDCSSLLYEAWALGKPVVFPDWLVKESIITRWPQSFAAQIYKDEIGYHAQNFNEIVEAVYQALEHGLDEKSRTFIEAYFPTAYRGRSGQICAGLLENLAAQEGRSEKPRS
ncbi:MAG TPA: CDP-glycerol glycerophosphotransferase family protein [Syntrophomonadaceae bacterium]|nr:CDP-glycerol glycerophosphotransferase family protein [Syntrophomonadaceae bacterium]